ncbi:MAG: PGPGW domain-containing protein [Patescibacteria group bacterium]
MKKYGKRILLDGIGWLFIALGVIGIFLPFLQGFLFLAIGFYFLSLHSVWAHGKLHILRFKYPRLFGPMDKMDSRIRSFFGLEPL